MVVVNGKTLTIQRAKDVAERNLSVRASAQSLRRMDRFRALLEEKLTRGEVVYGVNTGFGSLSDKIVRPENLDDLQLNLIRSHSAGVGPPFAIEVVRTAMLIRLNNLLNGNSAARRELAELFVGMLNKGITPYVPEFGSLGAAGDLVPSAHMALTMVGEGKVYHKGRIKDSAEALSTSRLKPITLHAKEGLSLINSTAFTTALVCIAVHRADTLLGAGNSALSVTD